MNSSKKLIYIANLRLPTEKAYGIQITKMCEAFASQGIDVTLIHPFRFNHIRNNIFSYYSVRSNFKIKRIWAPDFYLPGRLNGIAVNIKTIISGLLLFFNVLAVKADTIYSRDEWPLYFLSFFKNNLIFEAHRFSKKREFFYRRFKDKKLKVVVITKQTKEDFVKIGFGSESVLVAPDGVDMAEFDINISKENARIKVGLPVNKKIVMYTGHFFEWKGADVLMESTRNFKKEEDVLFVFVGGTEHDIERFKQKIREGDIKNVLILGHKPHKDIPLFLKAADVLVLPNSAKEEISRLYTSPLKLFEYMASGRPIVASDLSAITDILNNKNSILVKPDDPDSLARGIMELTANSLFGKELSDKAKVDAEEYTWTKRANKIKNFMINV